MVFQIFTAVSGRTPESRQGLAVRCQTDCAGSRCFKEGRGPCRCRPCFRSHVPGRGREGHGRGRRAVQCRREPSEPRDIQLGRQISTKEAPVPQQGSHRLRVEQIQPNPLRVRDYNSCMVNISELSIVRIILPQKSCRVTNSIYSTLISSKARRPHRMSRLKSLETTRQWCFGLPPGHLTRISLSGSSIGIGSFLTRSKQSFRPYTSSFQLGILGDSSVPSIVDVFLFGSTSVVM